MIWQLEIALQFDYEDTWTTRLEVILNLLNLVGKFCDWLVINTICKSGKG
jgi:hypothetical protein